MGKSLISRVRESASKILVIGLTGILPYTGCISPDVASFMQQGSISTAGEWSDLNNNRRAESFEVSNLGKRVFYPGEKIGVFLNLDFDAYEVDAEKIVELAAFDEEKQAYLPHVRVYEKPNWREWRQYFPIEIKEEDKQKHMKGRLTLIVTPHFSSAKKVLTADFLYNPPAQRQTSIPTQSISP